MKRFAAGLCFVLLAFAASQAVPSAQNCEAPTIAFDITKAETIGNIRGCQG
jgi:hypothetical protein